MLRKGNLIKHANSLDCALRVWYEPRVLENGHLEFQGGWYNLGFTNSFFMGRTQTITLSPEILSRDWYILKDPDFLEEPVFSPCLKCYRYSEWEKLRDCPLKF